MVTMIAENMEVQSGLYADVLRFDEENEVYFMVDDFDIVSGFRRFLLTLEELINYVGGAKLKINDWGLHFRTEEEYCSWVNRNVA